MGYNTMHVAGVGELNDYPAKVCDLNDDWEAFSMSDGWDASGIDALHVAI